MWGYLIKCGALWLIGLGVGADLIISLVSLASGDGSPGFWLLMAVLHAGLFFVVWKIPTQMPEDFLPEDHLKRYHERLRRDKNP